MQHSSTTVAIVNRVASRICEQDSMTTPDQTQAPPGRIVSGMIEEVYGPGNIFLRLSGIELVPAQFQNGKITLLDSTGAELGTFDVQTNTGTVVTLDEPGAASAVSFRDLYDDDYAHGVGVQEMMPELGGLASRLAPACIVPVTDRNDLAAAPTVNVNESGTTPFVLNVDTDSLEARTSALANRQSVSSQDFWVVYLVGAFQPGVAVDRDSDHEQGEEGDPPLLGESFQKGSLIFRETLRDSHLEPSAYVQSEAQLWQAIAIHELGHQLGITGEPLQHSVDMGTIMHYASMHELPFEQLVFAELGFKQMVVSRTPGTGLPFP
jgi:hypothetical protein